MNMVLFKPSFDNIALFIQSMILCYSIGLCNPCSLRVSTNAKTKEQMHHLLSNAWNVQQPNDRGKDQQRSLKVASYGN